MSMNQSKNTQDSCGLGCLRDDFESSALIWIPARRNLCPISSFKFSVLSYNAEAFTLSQRLSAVILAIRNPVKA
jgi:hypothetical protein